MRCSARAAAARPHARTHARAGDGLAIEVSPVSSLDPATPCLGVALRGVDDAARGAASGEEPFARLLDAVERWVGHPVPAVCSLEGGGMNGLAPLTLAGSHVVLDADCTGPRRGRGWTDVALRRQRAGARLRLRHGCRRVALVEAHRAIDAERVVRSAIIQAGGVGCAVLGGFTVGDLREHAIGGHLAYALELGRAYLAASRCSASPPRRRSGGRAARRRTYRLGRALAPGPARERGRDQRSRRRGAPRGHPIRGAGRAHRRTPRRLGPHHHRDRRCGVREILEVTELGLARNVAVFAVPAPEW